MPVRLTDSVDRDSMLYRGRRGYIVGWAPHPAEERVAMDGAWALTKMPLAIYVRFENSPWTIHETSEKEYTPSHLYPALGLSTAELE